jgi:hypothetical protein
LRPPPEPLLTLEEACRRYFPGKSACALRWMIKRRGYAHSRWGREYWLTPSQVAAIVDDLARPAEPSYADNPRLSAAVRQARTEAQSSKAAASPGAIVLKRGEVSAEQSAGSRRLLEERLSAPLSDRAT